jgi:hypothetical protein
MWANYGLTVKKLTRKSEKYLERAEKSRIPGRRTPAAKALAMGSGRERHIRHPLALRCHKSLERPTGRCITVEAHQKALLGSVAIPTRSISRRIA